jgi:hypothetical protein
MLIHPAFWLGAAVVAAIEFWPQISKATRPTGVKMLKAGLAAGEHVKKSVSRAKEGFDDMVAEAKSESAHEHHAAEQEPEQSK